MRRILLYFALKYKGDFNQIKNAIIKKEQVPESIIERVESCIKCKYVTIIDDNYPSALKSLMTPPIVLFYYGNLDVLNKHEIIATIGKRDFTLYGETMTKRIVSKLAKRNVATVSGMALGIDAIAHSTSLENKIPTIAILGSGIDYIYPPENEQLYHDIINSNGLIMSEHPGNYQPEPYNFLIRNRIIAALATKIVVFEANYKSGTMNTVAYGLDLGKDIYAIPYPAVEESGCNYLIKQGAKLVETAEDILD